MRWRADGRREMRRRAAAALTAVRPQDYEPWEEPEDPPPVVAVLADWLALPRARRPGASTLSRAPRRVALSDGDGFGGWLARPPLAARPHPARLDLAPAARGAAAAAAAAADEAAGQAGGAARIQAGGALDMHVLATRGGRRAARVQALVGGRLFTGHLALNDGDGDGDGDGDDSTGDSSGAGSRAPGAGEALRKFVPGAGAARAGRGGSSGEDGSDADADLRRTKSPRDVSAAYELLSSDDCGSEYDASWAAGWPAAEQAAWCELCAKLFSSATHLKTHCERSAEHRRALRQQAAARGAGGSGSGKDDSGRGAPAADERGGAAAGARAAERRRSHKKRAPAAVPSGEGSSASSAEEMEEEEERGGARGLQRLPAAETAPLGSAGRPVRERAPVALFNPRKQQTMLCAQKERASGGKASARTGVLPPAHSPAPPAGARLLSCAACARTFDSVAAFQAHPSHRARRSAGGSTYGVRDAACPISTG